MANIELPPMPKDPLAPADPLKLVEIGALLIKHYGLHEGVFEISVEYQFGSAAMGPNPDNIVPSVILGAHRIGLRRVIDGRVANTIDAAAVNPRAPRRVVGRPRA